MWFPSKINVCHLLLFLAAVAAAALDGAPPPRRNASGCVSFSSPSSMARTRAMVGLYSGSSASSVLLEDISDAVTRVLMARAGEDQDQGWQLCVELVDSPDPRDEHSHEDGSLGTLLEPTITQRVATLSVLSALVRDDAGKGAAAITAADDVVAVEVDSLVDSAVNISACAAPSATTGRCNFRSAVSYCESALSEQTRLSCVVSLPANETLDMDPALGEMSIDHIDGNGHMTIYGNGAVVRSEPASSASARLLSVIASASLGLTMTNMTVTGFGGDSIDGGSIMLRGLQEIYLKSISFSTGRGYNGGVLYFTECSGVSISSCIFNDTSASGNGGAIYLYSFTENIQLSDCFFAGTFAASDGGAVYLNKENHDMVITGCVFFETSAGGSGGSVSLLDDNDGTIVSDCSFNATSAGQDGGAIYVYRNTYEMTVVGCTFAETSAFDGGAIYLHDSNFRFSILDCAFVGTAASKDGGSLYSYDDNGFMSVSESSFINGFAANVGGVIYMGENNDGFALTSCVVSGSTSGLEGGAVYLSVGNDGAVISNCVFNNTISGDDGGSIFLDQNNQDMEISDCLFTSATAEDNGGALYLHQKNHAMTISSCDFDNVTAGRNGGVLYFNLDNIDVSVSGCSFVSTSATDWGGALTLNVNNFNMRVSGCLFTGTMAGDGGAMNIGENNYGLSIWKCLFIDISSGGDGGAILMYQDNENMAISDCAFMNTVAEFVGGSLYLDEDNDYAAIVNCSFTDTYAGSRAGSIYLDQNIAGTLISNCTFTNTYAGQYGGSLYLYQDNDDMTVSGCIFIGNSAGTSGGSVYLYQNNWGALFVDCSFIDNSAEHDGGSIHLYVASIDAMLMNCSFTDTSAGNAGGAVHAYVNNNGLRIISCSFVNGVADTGGGIYLGYDNNDVQLQDIIFHDNFVPTRGGAVLAHSGNLNLRLVRCLFDKNTAYGYGGAIAGIDSNSGLLLDNCVIQGSWASVGGGLYIGENTDDVLLNNTIIESNVAAFGGGVYLAQSRDVVTFSRMIIKDNYASSEGGGVFALCGQLIISSSFILYNNALRSAAIHSQSDTVLVKSSVVAGNLGRSTSGSLGGMYLSSVVSVTITDTNFNNNSAGSAGAILLFDCKNVNIKDCQFEDNWSREGDGGALFSDLSSVTISGCHFYHNTAYVGGGAIHATGATSVSVSNCTFASNNATTGNGAAMWISSSDSVTIAGNKFSYNAALKGGGTVYWVATSSMEEPAGILKANHFSYTNEALYGSTVATDAVNLVLADSNVYNVTSYATAVPPLVAHVLDYYDHIVGTDSSLLLASINSADAVCYQSTGYVTGSVIESSESGIANFTDLWASCDPGYSLTVYLTTVFSDDSLQAISEFWFRDCITGEYWGERICNPCETGTFSVTDPATVASLSDLTHQNVCVDCPEGSDSCFGDTVIVSKGYWRISQQAKSTTKCPYEGSCGGGSETGDGLCTSGYEGPVCGVCSEGYSYRSSIHQCQPCSDSAGLDVVTIFLLSVALIAVLIALYMYLNPKFRTEVKTVSDFYVLLFTKLRLLENTSEHNGDNRKKEADTLQRRLRARLKFYIIVWQVGSLLPFTLDTNFPDAYTYLASVFSFFNLRIDATSLAKCSTDVTLDAIDNLVLQTVYPVAATLLLYIAQLVHVSWMGERDTDSVSRIRSRYFSIFLVFTYLVLPFVSVVIFQTFSCQDVDPDDVESGDDTYMTMDYSVSCASSKYDFGFIWAIVSIFVYPVGVPSYYFYLLYSSRHDIMSCQDFSSQPVEQVPHDDRLRSRQVLFEFYAPQFWFWEVVETVHRLLLTGVLVIIAQGSGAQIIVGVTVALLFLKLIDMYQPYADPNVQQIRVLCQWQIYFVFFLALVLRADFDSVDRTALDALLVLGITANLIVDAARFMWWRFCLKERFPARRGDVQKSDTVNPLSDNDESARDTLEDGSSFGRGVAMSDLSALKELSERTVATP